jgi:hypothetical protein
VRRRRRDFAFREVRHNNQPASTGSNRSEMQPTSFANLQHRSPSAGTRPGAPGETCAAILRGEVRSFAPFGLMHLPETADAKAVETIERRGKFEQEQRGRTGLAA